MSNDDAERSATACRDLDLIAASLEADGEKEAAAAIRSWLKRQPVAVSETGDRDAIIEECAKVCDAHKERMASDAAEALASGDVLLGHRQLVAELCATSIRAIKGKPAVTEIVPPEEPNYLLKLQAVFDSHFSSPFIRDGHVSVKFVDTTKGSHLEIKIGRRDVWIDKEFNVVGAGTSLMEKP